MAMPGERILVVDDDRTVLTYLKAVLGNSISDRFLPGMTVSGFGGAIIAAIAIAVVGWAVAWLLSLLGISV